MSKLSSPQFGSQRTRRQVLFDFVVGVLLPIACVWFDPLVFQRGRSLRGSSSDLALLEHFQTFAYGGILFEITLLSFWLIGANRLRNFSGFFGGAFAAGAVAFIVLGIRILPYSIVGLVIGGGVLGFSLFLIAFVYARNSVQAFSIGRSRSIPSLIMGASAGLLLAIAVSFFCHTMVPAFSFEALFKTLKGFKGTRVAFSPNSQAVAGGHADGMLQLLNIHTEDNVLWNVHAGDEIWSIKAHEGQITSVAFASKLVATAGTDGFIRLWRADNGKPITQFYPLPHGAINSIALSSDGRQLVSGGVTGSVLLWSISSGKHRQLGRHVGPVNAVGLSMDNAKVVSAGDDKVVQLWNAATGEKIVEFRGHAGRATAVAFAPDGNTVLSGSGWIRMDDANPDGDLFIWDTETGEIVKRVEMNFIAFVLDARFSSDGNRVAIGGWRRSDWLGVSLIDFQSGEYPFNFGINEMFRCMGASMSFSWDGQWLATGSRDNVMRVWNAQKSAILSTNVDELKIIGKPQKENHNEQVAWLIEGDVEKWNKWRKKNYGIPIDLGGINFQETNLIKVDFRGVDLKGAIFRNANLSNAILRGVDLSNAVLSDANFHDTDLRYANLENVYLSGVNLSGANLFCANLSVIKYWKIVADLNLTNIYGVKNPPEGFIEFAKAKGAVEIEDHEEWLKLIEPSKRKTK